MITEIGYDPKTIPCVDCITYPICQTIHKKEGPMMCLIALTDKCSLLDIYLREIEDTPTFFNLERINITCKYFNLDTIHYTLGPPHASPIGPR